MAVEPQSSLPQWLITPLAWCIGFLATIITGTFGWYLRSVWVRQTSMEKGLASLELQIVPLISQTQLMAHLAQIREESDDRFEQLRIESNRRFDQLRDDRQRMHQENLDGSKQLRQEIADNGEAVRGDIRGVHSRIDDVFKAMK